MRRLLGRRVSPKAASLLQQCLRQIRSANNQLRFAMYGRLVLTPTEAQRDGEFAGVDTRPALREYKVH
jgi:hypothetical protein